MQRRKLGVYIPRMDDNCQRIMRGVVRYLHEQGGWELITHEAMPWMPWETLRRFRGDGMIAVVFTTEEYRALQRRRMPCVNVCARCETPRLASVYSDNPQIGRLAATTLWEQGLRHFAFVGRPGFYHDLARGAGFQEELQARMADCAWIEVEAATDHLDDKVDMSKIMGQLRRLPRPVGIFAAHDHLGCHVLTACRRVGINVPHEAAVLGVNDFTLMCETAQPPLSSIRQQAERTGYEAAQLLTDIVEGRAARQTQLLLPPGEVIHRRSTETLALDDPEMREAVLYIRNHLAEAISIEDVAQHLAMSRRGLDKRFLAAVGHTPGAELRRVRLRRGAELLSQTKLSITEISARCGFAATSSFDRAFREMMGMTPREYRSTHRAEI